jgi:hypothetical protein
MFHLHPLASLVVQKNWKVMVFSCPDINKELFSIVFFVSSFVK